MSIWQHVQHVWVCPPERSLEINFDGAFISQERRWAYGFIIRDNQGDGVAGGSDILEHVLSLLQAEAMDFGRLCKLLRTLVL